MTAFLASAVEGTPRTAQHESIVEGLKRAADVLEKRGVTLLLENIDLEEPALLFVELEGLVFFGRKRSLQTG